MNATTPVQDLSQPVLISDDLWFALGTHNPAACQERQSWTEQCAPLHDGQVA